MDFHGASDRYLHDPRFKAVVDEMVAMAMSMDMSPGEIRIAAGYAELQFFASQPARLAFPQFAQDIQNEYSRQRRVKP